MNPKHSEAFNAILKEFADAGYIISYQLLNANDFDVPEDRFRVIIVGYRKDLNKKFEFPAPQKHKPVLKDAIYDLRSAKPALEKNKTNGDTLLTPNHEYMT